MLVLKNAVFLNAKLKIPYHKFLIFLSFMNILFFKKLRSNIKQICFIFSLFYSTDYEVIKQLFHMHSQRCEIQQIYNETSLSVVSFF